MNDAQRVTDAMIEAACVAAWSSWPLMLSDHDCAMTEVPECRALMRKALEAGVALLAESEPPQSNLATLATNLRIENERLTRELEAATAPVSAPEVTDEHDLRLRSRHPSDVQMGVGALRNLLRLVEEKPHLKLGRALQDRGMYCDRDIFRSLRDWLERLAIALEAAPVSEVTDETREAR